MLDCIVVGLGATGSATIYQLARRGAKVLGIDRFSPPHTFGSSHGDTRITRQAIGEGEIYTPLVLRSHGIWRAIEAETGDTLMVETGGLVISSRERRASTHGANFFENTLAAARRFSIAHEVLDAAQIRKRFPQFEVAGNEVGYYESGAGYLRPEACIAAQLRLAERNGAELHRNERLREFSSDGRTVSIVTDKGRYEGRTLILAVGPWLPEFLPGAIARHFRIVRQVQFWFELDPGPLAERPTGMATSYSAPNFPVWIWELQDRPNVIYGFPAIDGPGGGVKVATEQYAEATTADGVERDVSEDEKQWMHRELIAGHLRGVGDRCLKAASCLYTLTRDFHFVIDRHPAEPNVIVASPCSGHGFKHSPALGEMLAEAALGAPMPDNAAFRFSRFGEQQ